MKWYKLYHSWSMFLEFNAFFNFHISLLLDDPLNPATDQEGCAHLYFLNTPKLKEFEKCLKLTISFFTDSKA